MPTSDIPLLQLTQHLQNFVVWRLPLPWLTRLHVANHTLLVNHEPGAFRTQVSGASLGILGHFGVIEEDAIGFRHLAARITYKRIGKTELFGPGLVCIIEIDTHAQNLGIGGLKLGQVKLKGQRFLRSTSGKSADVEEHHHWLFSYVVGKFYFVCRGSGEGKIWGFVAHLQGQSMAHTHTEDDTTQENSYNQALPSA